MSEHAESLYLTRILGKSLEEKFQRVLFYVCCLFCFKFVPFPIFLKLTINQVNEDQS